MHSLDHRLVYMQYLLEELLKEIRREEVNYQLDNFLDVVYTEFELKEVPKHEDISRATDYELSVEMIDKLSRGIYVSLDTAIRFLLSFPFTERELIGIIKRCMGKDLSSKEYGFYRIIIHYIFVKVPIERCVQKTEYYRVRNRRDCEKRRDLYLNIKKDKKKFKLKKFRNSAIR